MGLDWSTFVLELINFLILVWILKHFLYAPVKAAIEARRERIAAELAEADSRRAEAEQMREAYEARQQAWEQERSAARAALDQELAAERARRLDALQAGLQGQRDKAAILDERRARDAERRVQEEALVLAARFGSKLLGRLAGPELEARLAAMVIAELPAISEGHRQALAEGTADPAGVRIQSAYPLADMQRGALRNVLQTVAGRDLTCRFSQEPELIAGLRISAGPLVIGANLRDELRFFAEAGR